MLIELDGEKYAIRFEHEVEDKYTTVALYKVAGEYVSDDGNVLREGKYALQEPEIAVGEALCHWKDQYSKKTGRKIAFARLLEWMTKNRFMLTREDRTRLWEQYFQYVRK